MTNQELLEKKEKAQKILEVWLNNISNPMITEIAVITIEALENYIESIDNELKMDADLEAQYQEEEKRKYKNNPNPTDFKEPV